jgi:mycoredoxin-dependent peroxiredoxin
MANNHLTPRESPIKVGEKAPDFTLQNQDREDVTLHDILRSGKEVVLSFYPFDFSPVCSTEMGCFTRDVGQFQDKGAVVMGVSCDSPWAHKAWSEQLGLHIGLLSDLHRDVCRAYGFYFAPLNVASRGTVVIGTDGVVKWVNTRELKDAIDNNTLLAAIS